MILNDKCKQYIQKLILLFEKDPEIQLNIEDNNITLTVTNASKAEALTELLPNEITYDNDTLYLSVVYSKPTALSNLYYAAFTGNPAFHHIYIENKDKFFVLFNDDVMKYSTADSDDYCGQRTCLYEDIAAEVFYKGNFGTYTKNNYFNIVQQ